MANITGIIAEFNPFHNGHKYLLDAVSADSPLVVAMSGNWVQRGEPAIFDKWTRAEMALRNGADLVVELPTLVSVQAADYFAAGAVRILHELGVNQLLFGSESSTDYNQIARLYAEKGEAMERFIKSLPDTMSYPEKTQKMWAEFTSVKFDGNTPNHVLGLAYAKAAAGKGIDLRTVRRVGDFHSSELTGEFASATAIRQHLSDGFSAVQNFVPSGLTDLYSTPKVSWDDYFPLLRYKIMLSELTENYQVNQELAVRLKNTAQAAQSVDELIELAHTKRYTKARVRRVLVYILLDIHREFTLPEQIHVLGFTQKGQKLLSKVKDKVVTKIGQHPWDEITQKADSIYQLGNPDIKAQNHGRKPLIVL